MERIAKEWIPNSTDTDEELSKGEFTDDKGLLKYYEQSKLKKLQKDIRRRKKYATKIEKRLGGPLKMWSERAHKRKAEKMAKAAKIAKEDVDVEETESKKKVEKPVKEKAKAKAKEPEKEIVAKKTKGKEVKKEKVAKEEKEKKEKKVRKERSPSIVDGKIILLAKENPKRKDTNAYKKFELYKKHKSIASFLDAGGKRSSLRYDEKHEYIKLTNLVRKGETKGKKEAA